MTRGSAAELSAPGISRGVWMGWSSGTAFCRSPKEYLLVVRMTHVAPGAARDADRELVKQLAWVLEKEAEGRRMATADDPFENGNRFLQHFIVGTSPRVRDLRGHLPIERGGQEQANGSFDPSPRRLAHAPVS
jgi:hypothetical protein